MVGVARKSKGCNTCKKRKIKCDEAGIPCGPCKKGQRPCGYQRDRHFKNLSVLDHDSLLSRTQPLVPNTEPSVLRYEPITYRKGCTTTLPEDFRLLHERVHAIKNGQFEIGWRTASIVDASSASIKAKSSLTQHCTRSFEYGTLGRKYENERLRKRGMALYGQALEGVQKALSSTTSLCEDQVLASCLTMAVFQLLEMPSHDIYGWTSHVRGLSKLFLLRGPRRQALEPSHSLFLGFRATEVIHAIATRKETYLSKPGWLTEPWRELPKSDFHDLLDLMTRLANVLEATKKSCQSSNQLNALEASLCQNRDLERDLRWWYEGLQAKSQTPMFTFSTAKRASQSGDTTGVSIHFADFEIARIHLFYWTTLLFLHTSMQTTSQHVAISRIQIYEEALEITSIEDRMLETVTLILQSMPYLLLEER